MEQGRLWDIKVRKYTLLIYVNALDEKEEYVSLSVVEIEQRRGIGRRWEGFANGGNFLETKIKGFMVEGKGP